jgi:glycosyl transferase family 25
MQAYVINLARSADRRAHIVAELDKTGIAYQIVQAVNGRDLDLSNADLVEPRTVETCFDGAHRPAGVAGGAACALSHLKVYRKVLEEAEEHALVLEDDVLLPLDFASLANEVSGHMRGAEVVLLNFHSPRPCQVRRAGSVALASSRSLVRPAQLRDLTSAGAYLITKEACARMARTVLPVRANSDKWELFVGAGAIDTIRCVVPMPVRNSPAFRSTIDYYRPGTLQARIREPFNDRRLPIVSQLLELKRERTFRKLGLLGKIEFVDEPGEPTA